MPFTIIRGAFRLVGRNKKGGNYGFEPDGDSIQFQPDKPSLLKKLDQTGHAYELNQIGSLNLRFEGIDATELHYAGTHQPWDQGTWARDFLTKTLALDPVTYSESGIRVTPPAPNDGQRGYILSRQLDVHGRPVSFVFGGTSPKPDGETFVLTPQLLKQSLNYKALSKGWVYPLFYDTLFPDLRAELSKAAQAAYATYGDPGLWPYDWSLEGAPNSGITPLVDSYPVFPKLFRRLVDYFKDQSTLTQDKLKKWMDDKHDNDEVWTLPETGRTHFDNVVEVKGGKVRLTRNPWELVFVSK